MYIDPVEDGIDEERKVSDITNVELVVSIYYYTNWCLDHLHTLLSESINDFRNINNSFILYLL